MLRLISLSSFLFVVLAVEFGRITDIWPNDRDFRSVFEMARKEASIQPSPSSDPSDRYFRCIPEFVTYLQCDEVVKWTDPHFNFSAETTIDGNDVKVSLSLKRKSLGEGNYLFAAVRGIHPHVFFLAGDYDLVWKDMQSDELEFVKKFGIMAFRLDDNIFNALVDLFDTLEMFIGVIQKGHVLKISVDANLKFLKDHMGITLQERTDLKPTLDAKDVRSGDVFTILRLDGLDPLIMWFTGGRTGHTAVALEINGTMMICESQSAFYWPVKGIQCNPYDKWVQWALNADYNVIHLPLLQQYREMFDLEKAYSWFETVKGQPYGFQNFIWVCVDTVADNFPPPISPQILQVAGSILQKWAPSVVELFANQALNHRLGTKNLDFYQIVAAVTERNLTVMDLAIVPEQDSWLYDGNVCRVCSSFILSMYKKGGLFSGIDFQATESQPRDLYSLKIFDRSFLRPQACVAADPELPYCQLMGKYRIELPESDYSTIEPYGDYAETCPTLPPDYRRIPGC